MLTYESLLAHADGKYMFDQTNLRNIHIQIPTKALQTIYTQYSLGVVVPHTYIQGMVFDMPANRTAFAYISFNYLKPSLTIHVHRVINKPGDDWLLTLCSDEHIKECIALINSVKD